MVMMVTIIVAIETRRSSITLRLNLSRSLADSNKALIVFMYNNRKSSFSHISGSWHYVSKKMYLVKNGMIQRRYVYCSLAEPLNDMFRSCIITLATRQPSSDKRSL